MCDETYTPEKQEFSEKEWNLIYTAVIDRFTESKEGVPMDDIENWYSGQWWDLCVKVSEHRQALEQCPGSGRWDYQELDDPQLGECLDCGWVYRLTNNPTPNHIK